jgi:hypothetical protein
MAKNRNLSRDERQIVYEFLLVHCKQHSETRVLKYGALREASAQFGLSYSTVQRIWSRAEKSVAEGNSVVSSVSPLRKGRCGRKKKEISPEELMAIPFHKRGTIRNLAAALNASYGRVWRRIKEKKIRRHSSAVKPALTDKNVEDRVSFCLQHVGPNFHFVDFNDVIHVDEKWFYLIKVKRSVYLAVGEEEPYVTAKSKRFIPKVMFLSATARPRGDFDGKLGLWPFVTQEAAKRNSVNRPRGTIVTKCMEVDRDTTYRNFIIEKLLPAIDQKWPDRNSLIKIQQDNAKPHIAPDDETFKRAVLTLGLNIELTQQPANSPDTNVNDLGFFASIQSLQYTKVPKNVDELIAAVQEAYEDYPSSKLNKVFLTLQTCMIEILRSRGSNRYKIPHFKKQQLERAGLLPESIQLPIDVATMYFADVQLQNYPVESDSSEEEPVEVIFV